MDWKQRRKKALRTTKWYQPLHGYLWSQISNMHVLPLNRTNTLKISPFHISEHRIFLTSFKPATKITRKVMRFPFNMYRVNLYMVQRWNWIVAILFRAMIDILLLSHFSSLHIHEINIRELIMTLLQYPELIKKVLYWCMYGICF